MTLEIRRGPFTLSTDKSRIDVAAVQGFLSRSYWAPNVPESVVRRSIDGSLCVGVYEGEKQVGFGRVVTDYATFAWIADVFVLEPWRGRGLATWIVETMLVHEDLAGMRRWLLATKDAHEVYARKGFVPVARPERFMEIVKADPYGPGVTS
jgi:GNAT superfamily N-acetyltransferase